ncbi:MAG: DUF5681 domain-containing protein [Pseudomonadota bacterium]
MSQPVNPAGQPGTSVVPAGYDVGYGRPPATTRFAKGQSGNPRGRPKRAKAPPQKLDPAAKPTDDLILAEAYRLVTIREGDTTIELPAIQAAMRSLAISAMKGSRLSQKALAEIVREVEQRHLDTHQTALENAFEYKQRWTEELKRRDRLGIVEPDPVPHPDDISINLRTGRVRTEGPLDEVEKAEWDLRLARRAEAQSEVDYYADQYRRSRTPEKKALWLQNWHFEQRIFDIINDAMPKRYKAKLGNRSRAEGASREGKALEEFRKMRQ